MMVEAKLLRKKLKNGLIVDKWDLVKIIEQQADRIAELEKVLEQEGIGIGRDLLHGGIAVFKKPKQTKPLSDEEIEECWVKAGWHKESCIDEDLKFARAIEAKVRGQ